MGKSNPGGVQQPNVAPVSAGTTGTRTANSNSASSTNTSSNTGNTSDTAQGIPRPVLVDITSGTVKADKKKNRPTGMTYNKDKPKPAASNKRSDGPSLETLVLVQSITQALFTIPANRLGPHWKLTDDEAGSIAGPAGALVHRYFGALDEHSDAAALAIALGGVIIGRVMIQVTLPKKEGKKDGPGPAAANQSGPSEAVSAKPTGKGQQSGTSDGTTTSKQLLESFPAASY